MGAIEITAVLAILYLALLTVPARNSKHHALELLVARVAALLVAVSIAIRAFGKAVGQAFVASWLMLWVEYRLLRDRLDSAVERRPIADCAGGE